MNDQEEILIRQSKWSGRRIVLFYWFAIIFIGTSAAAGLGATILTPKFGVEAFTHPTIPEPWHADDCAACHQDEVDGWNTTWHAQLVGEFDPTDITLNGSRVSYNSTHYWRTPKTPTNVSDLTNTSNIRYWTYNQLFNASGQQCCMTTRWANVTLINSTTGAELAFNATLSAELNGYNSNIWDIGVSCAACHTEPGVVASLSFMTCRTCHTPGGMQWRGYTQSGHYNSLAGLLANTDVTTQTLLHYTNYWAYVGQSTYTVMGELDESEFYGITCVTCHDPHDSTVNAADNSSGAMSPWANPYTGEKFGPGGHQLRSATVNDLCGVCHDVNLNTTTGSYLDPSNHTDLVCTDCHGYSYSTTTNTTSSLSHNWFFNYDETGCGVCHGENASTVLGTMLGYQADYGGLTALKASYDVKYAAAMAAFDTANATTDADAAKLDSALALIEEAADLAEATNLLFHNPELGTAVDEDRLALALTKLDAALQDATDALPEPEETTTTTTPVVTTTTTVPPTTTPTPAIGIMSVMAILAFVALFLRKRR